MLKTIIKRDGREEAYSPNKLNHWGMWASKHLGDRVDWSGVVTDTIKEMPERVDSQTLQLEMINQCLQRKDWPHNLMAGRLYAPWLHKKLYGDEKNLPTPQEVSTKLAAVRLGRTLNYTQAEWDEVATIIDHSRDYGYAHFQIEQNRKKYALQDRTTKTEYESPQFIFMRMAMALAEDEPADKKMTHLKNWYDHFSENRINCPSPNYINLGTELKGYASCCLYKSGDTAKSLAIGDHIAYTMTYMSAGIGGYIECRSLGDPVRGGAIEHQGKLPYFNAVAKGVKANTQAGRGGACTQYYSGYDPEAVTIAQLQNPRSVADKRNRDIHFAMLVNRWLAKKVAKNEQVFFFNCFTAPDLHRKMFSGDQDGFEALYKKYEEDENFQKTYISARELIIDNASTQSFAVGTHYYCVIDEANRHTPYNTEYEPIHSANLCLEITEPNHEYNKMQDLYSTEDNGFVFYKDTNGASHRQPWSDRIVKSSKKTGSNVVTFAGTLEVGDILDNGIVVAEILEKEQTSEVAMCSLAAIVTSNIENDEQYESATYYALKMIDKCIHMSHYELPHIGYTAKNRMNAGVGIVGTAYDMARAGLKYSTLEGRNYMHQMAERHYYWLVEASLRIAKERGNAPWIHKTKWVEGWLPIDTYKKTVDQITTEPLHYNWESLRTRILAQGGIGHSCLSALMPTESSSKASGMPNCVYPIRELAMKKSDQSNVVDWCAPDGDLLADHYELAYDISTVDMIKCYAVWQKFNDLGISADFWKNRIKNPDITTDEMNQEFIDMVKYGMKGRYYQNSLTNTGKEGETKVDAPKLWLDLNKIDPDNYPLPAETPQAHAECVGSCTL